MASCLIVEALKNGTLGILQVLAPACLFGRSIKHDQKGPLQRFLTFPTKSFRKQP